MTDALIRLMIAAVVIVIAASLIAIAALCSVLWVCWAAMGGV